MATTPKQLPAQKPRNFVAKNALGGGAGAHKDKKKALKQGDVKHKNKSFDMAEALTTELRDYDKIAKAIATKSAEDPRPTLAKAAKASMVKRHAEEKAAEKKARDAAKSKGDARVQESLEPLRKKKIKESYTDFLHNVLEEIISKKK